MNKPIPRYTPSTEEVDVMLCDPFGQYVDVSSFQGFEELEAVINQANEFTARPSIRAIVLSYTTQEGFEHAVRTITRLHSERCAK